MVRSHAKVAQLFAAGTVASTPLTMSDESPSDEQKPWSCLPGDGHSGAVLKHSTAHTVDGGAAMYSASGCPF